MTKLRERLHKWAARLRELDDKIESLEFAIVLGAGVMAFLWTNYPAHETGSHAADALFHLVNRDVWVTYLWVTFLVGLFGYLDDHATLRRLSAFASFLFWYCSGMFLTRIFPHFYLPYLHILIGFFSAFVMTRIAEIKIQAAYRTGQNPPPWWWFFGPWSKKGRH